MDADDSMICRCVHSGVKRRVGVFQNPGVCLQAFPSFTPLTHSPPSFFCLSSHFSRGQNTKNPFLRLSLLPNPTETLATQSNFRVAVCLFFRSSAHAKRFTWKWLDFHENEWTGDIQLVLNKDSATEAKVNLELAYSSMSCHREPLIKSKLQGEVLSLKFAKPLIIPSVVHHIFRAILDSYSLANMVNN